MAKHGETFTGESSNKRLLTGAGLRHTVCVFVYGIEFHVMNPGAIAVGEPDLMGAGVKNTRPVEAISKERFMLKKYSLCIVVAGLLLALGASAWGQNATGRIVGTVTDPQGAVVAGAKVTVINTATGVGTSTVTNGEGYFDVQAVPIGWYKVSVDHPGFSVAVTQEKELFINETNRYDITLVLGAQTQTISVEARVSGVETASSTIGESVTGQAISDLPLNGRDLLQLALLQPGVTQANDSAAGHGFSISGNRTDAVTYLLDGGLNTDLMTNTVVLNPNPDAVEEFRVLTSNYDAEYGRNAGGIISVVTKSGTNTVHGSAYDYVRNDDFNANNFFNNLYGVPRSILKRHQFGGALGGPIEIPHLFNGKDKAFFFVNYQGQRQTAAVSSLHIETFTPLEMTGNFSQADGGQPDPNVATFLISNPYFQSNPTLAAQAIIDPTKINPVATNYIGLGLIPTSSSGFVSTSQNSKDNYSELTVKTDFVLTDKDRVAVTIGIHPEKVIAPYGDGYASVPGFNDQTTTSNYFSSVGYNRTISPTLLNELRFTAQVMETDQEYPTTTLPSPPTLGFFGIYPDVSNGPPILGFDGGLSLGFNANGPTRFADTTFSYSDTVSWQKGKHMLRFGGNFWTFADNFFFGFEPSGYFYFGSSAEPYLLNTSGNQFADFLLGNPTYYFQGPQAPNNVRTKATAVFAQDEWRVRSNLTLTLGLRYQYNTPKLDTKGRTDSIWPGQQSAVDSNAPVGILFPGDKGAPKGLFFPDKNNFAPRLGFAWDPRSDHKTSVRGGFGIFYDVLAGYDNIDQNGGPPFAAYVPLYYGGSAFGAGSQAPVQHFANPIVSFGIPNPFPTPLLSSDVEWGAAGFLPWAITVTNPHMRTPYVYQYNLSVQHEVAHNLTGQVSYVGSSSKKLQTVTQGNPMILGTQNRLVNLHQTNPDVLSWCNTFAAENGYTEPNGDGACPFGNFPQYISQGFASYNSLQSSLTKQSGETRIGSAYFTLAYTYGHSIDNTTGRGNRSQTVPYYDPGLWRASSDFDLTHTISFGGGWNLPLDKTWASGPKWLLKGWALFPIFSWRTGFTQNVGSQFSANPDSPGASGAGDAGSENAIFIPSLLHLTKPTLENNFQYFNTAAFSTNQYQDTDPTQPYYATCAQQVPASASSPIFPSFDCTAANPSLRTYGGPRNAFRGPGRTNLDLALAKSTQIFEKLNAQLRLEAFNVFNHTELDHVDTVNYDTTYGDVTSAYAPRILQIALRLTF